MTTKPKPLDFEAICAIEPEIAAVMAEVECRQPAPGENPWIVYGRYKRQLSELVGWWCHRRELQNNECYEIVVKRLVDAMEL